MLFSSFFLSFRLFFSTPKMSFQYCPMLDYPQYPIVYDDNLLSSIIPANMMIKQENMAAEDLLLTSGYYPHMHQEVPALGYSSEGYSHQNSNMSDLTYLAAATTTTTTNTATPVAPIAAPATAATACSSSPSSHYSYDSFYSPAESMTSFDFFPSTTYNDPSLYEYWSNNSSPAPVNQHFEALYFEQPSNAITMPSINTFSSLSSSTASSTSSSPSTSSASLATQPSATAALKSEIEGRPYSCPSCPRAFARKHDLQRHIRVHTGDKPYMCPCCKKTFARTDALKRHLRMEEQCRKSEQVQAMKDTGRRRYRNL
ncbi:unnamed protein product [Mucor circinelloides]